MHPLHRFSPAFLLLAALILVSPQQIRADSSDGLEAAGHLIEGENALQAGEYLTAAVEYRKAAELSDNVDVARKATLIALRLGFNEEALLSAERWIELDEESDEARILSAQLRLRTGDIRGARRVIEKLIDVDDENADRKLLSLLPVLSDEDPHNADLLMRELAKRYKYSAAALYATAVLDLPAGDAKYAL
jgi:tetratricopeptide (TPR) repeat protein